MPNRPSLAGLIVPLLLSACAGGGSTAFDAGDSGFGDICDYPDAGDAECQLKVVAGAVVSDGGGNACQSYYMDHVGKDLWLWMSLPSTLPAGTLYTIVAGYDVPSTPVDLALNLLQPNITTSIGIQEATQSPTGKPGTITYTFAPETAWAGQDLWLEFSDSTNMHDDVKDSFCVYAYTSPDPDPNSASTPTVVTLGAASSSNIQTGTCATTSSGACQGVLSTTGRVDTYTVAVPAGGNPQILYTDITAPVLTPEPAYDLAFLISNSAGTPLYANRWPNPLQQGDLPSALLVQPGATYTIQVFGLPSGVTSSTMIDPANAAATPPDPRLTYTLAIELLPNLDENPQSEGAALAAPLTFTGAPTAGSPIHQQLTTNRLSYVGQSNWQYLSFPATSGPTRLHYKFTPGAAGTGRYAAFGDIPPDRHANLLLDVPPLPDGGASTNACLYDPTVCPQDPEYTDCYIPDSGTECAQTVLRDTLCQTGDGDGGSLCLLSGREEFTAVSEGFPDLQNFEGIVPLTGNGAQGMFLNYYPSGTYCDDIPYTLDLYWESMTHPLSSQQSPLTFDSSGALGAATVTESGALEVGPGYLVQCLQQMSYQAGNPQEDCVRGADDYDATPSTADTWEVDIPSSLQGSSQGATWGLGWSVTDPTSGMPVESVELSVVFCDSSGSCNAAGKANDGLPGAIYYAQNDDLPWWDPGGNPFGPLTISDFGKNGAVLFDAGDIPNGESYAFTPFACACVQPNFLPAGKFFVTVVGADRTAWSDTDYTLSMSLSSYPQSTGVDGLECPTSNLANGDAGSDVGCQFIKGF